MRGERTLMNTHTSLTESLNTRQNEYRYLLLDPLKKVANWNSLHAEQLRNILGNGALSRVLRPDLAWSPEHCPLLVLLASPGETPNETLVQHSEDYARGEALYEKRYVCGWLVSPLAPDEMAGWLAALCRKIKQGSTLPVFEPLRLELLMATADPVLLAGQFASVSQWHLMSSAGERKAMNIQSSNDAWVLNWRAEQAQNDARNIWRILSAWQESGAALPTDAVRQAANAWNMSEKARLHHLSDRLYLALNTLTQPTDITRHAAVQTQLQKASDDTSLYFEQLMHSLPDAVWQELRHLSLGKKGI
ncbi:hypothetical protein UXO35_16305 [Enterobacter kobei]|uniref:hypothetical protein n=2 Tax=Enterobacter kobei TaxID=208224 RepID=UPI002FD54E86